MFLVLAKTDKSHPLRLKRQVEHNERVATVCIAADAITLIETGDEDGKTSVWCANDFRYDVADSSPDEIMNIVQVKIRQRNGQKN